MRQRSVNLIERLTTGGEMPARDTSALLKGHNLRRAGRGTTYKCVAPAPVAPRLGLCTQLSH